ncbi:MAG: L-serine ammonia-lyase, iron-sulfur-dependent, subunit alpha [Bacteroidales bacterium]|nr:serine dehydratase subunit alpha family protein [Candidatus Colimorpha merdihippi]MCQ2281650.1 L-serine ammonia-lyase, iron-sulfur-dependent, subunit alpha [Bacteroidales bacterium]
MEESLRRQLRQLIQNEVVLATGCTEPVAVALCVAKACETLGCKPEHVELRLSKNVYKNAMGVGIPGTGMIGLPIAVAIAVVAGDSTRQLEVLNVASEQVEEAKKWLANNGGNITIGVKDDCDKLYIECECASGSDKAKAIISHRHTNFIYVARNNDVLLSQAAVEVLQKEIANTTGEDEAQAMNNIKLTARMVYEYATTAPLEEIEFIRETVKYNDAASEEGLKGYGLRSGKILMENANGDLVHTVVARTVAASDARMDGCTLSVYSNSGSGNQGICCTLPVYNYGKEKGCSDEQITRALILNHLMSIFIKRGIGRLSALCGIVNASIGVACGIVYLHGGSFEQMGYAIKNLINTLAGMVCDGAKPSCALKMSTGIYSAFVCAELAYHNNVVDETDGLSESDVDRSIQNLGRLGREGMDEVDEMVLDIMTHKA